VLNQGGLLSLSSISPQTSGNPAPDAMECMLGVCESARSTDSGMLPQRPTRRHVLKPPHVPALDFSRLQQQPEEDEEEEDPGDGEEEGLAEEEYADGLEAVERAELRNPGSEEGYSPAEGEHEHRYWDESMEA